MKEKFYSKENYAKCKAYGITAFLVIAASIIFFFIIRNTGPIFDFIDNIFSVLTPITTGFVFAFLLNPILLFFEKIFVKIFGEKKVEKKPNLFKYISITLTMITGILIVAVIVMIIIPSLIKSITDLVNSFPAYADKIGTFLSKRLPADVINNIETQANNFVKKFVTGDLLNSLKLFSRYFASGIKGVYNVVVALIVGIVVAIYVLSSKDYFKRITQKFLCVILKKKNVNSIVSVAKNSYKVFTNFIVGKLVDSLIIGIICFVGMLILRMPYPVLISIIIGLTNIIPFFGPIIGAVPSILLLLVVDPWKALWFLIFVIVLQQFDGNILGPRILKGSLGISSFWIIFSIMFFGGLFGFIGMLVGAPLFAVIYNIVCRIIDRQLKKKGLPTDDEHYLDVTKN